LQGERGLDSKHVHHLLQTSRFVLAAMNNSHIISIYTVPFAEL